VKARALWDGVSMVVRTWADGVPSGERKYATPEESDKTLARLKAGLTGQGYTVGPIQKKKKKLPVKVRKEIYGKSRRNPRDGEADRQ